MCKLEPVLAQKPQPSEKPVYEPYFSASPRKAVAAPDLTPLEAMYAYYDAA